ncbi:MAG: hypothetical protein K6E10_00385 [Eubacterium sp.]|nr:hypothetical protein [Eubacterium sp.]
MDNIYKYFNDIETDFSEYEEETLSPKDVAKINSRINKILQQRKKTSNNTLTWIGRAAIISLCCLSIGGGVYAATTLRKNTKENLRIKSSESEVISTEDNKVTKKIFDEETGSELTYDVYTEAASSADGVSIERISKEGDLITMDVNIELDDISKFEPLRETFDTLVTLGHGDKMTQEILGNFSITSKLDDTEMLSWLNTYDITDNTLSMEIVIASRTTQALYDGSDPDLPHIEYDSMTGPSSVSEEDAQKEEEYFDNYYASLPDPLNCTITLDLFLGNDIGETYTFVTNLENNYQSSKNDRYNFDGGSATIEWYGQKESLSINSYSIEANGLELYGEYSKEDDYDAYTAELEKQGLFSYEEELLITAWDNLGNNYILNVEPGNLLETDPEIINLDAFTATLCRDGSELSWYKEITGTDYSSEWADGISEISLAIDKFTRIERIGGTENEPTREVTGTHELVSDPVTITLQ